MPDVIQRVLSALWRLILMGGIFGVAYIVWDAQVHPVHTILIPASWFFYSYVLVFPTSHLAAGLFYYFGLLDDIKIMVLIFIFTGFLSLHALYQHHPVGMIYIVAFGIIDFCIIQRRASRAAMESATTQPDAASVEAEDSDETNTDTDHESSLEDESEHSAEPTEPAEPEKLHDSEPSNGQLVLIAVPAGPSVEEVGQPSSWARSAMKILWSFLCAIVKVGAAALVIHFLIDVSLKAWTLTPVPVDIAPLFEPEVIIQANKTELPIPVPMAEFTPTGTFGSPCQAAPTPTPVAKSIVTVMSTPMPTPMPAPTPSAMPEPVPEPEPVAVPDEAFELLNRLFDFPFPDPKPLLTWYFDLPPSSQYAVIVASLLVLWCFSKPLAILTPNLIVLAVDYFAAAAMLPLLFRYGFAPKQAIVITFAADCALTVSIWYAVYWLLKLEAACRNSATGLDDVKRQSEDNASGIADLRNLSEDTASGLSDLRSQFRENDAGLTGLGNRFEEFVTQSKLGWADTVKPIAVFEKVLDILVFCVDSIGNRVDALAKTVRHHTTEIYALGKEVGTKADLEQTMRILEQISGRIASLETSKADAGILQAAQDELKSLRSLVENLKAEKVDAAELERVQKELKDLKSRIDNLETTKADATAVADVVSQVRGLVTDLNEMQKAQYQLNTRVDTLRTEMDGAQKDIKSLSETRTQHGDSINRLDKDAKESKNKYNDLNSQHRNDRKRADMRISELEKENANLRRDVGNLQGIAEGFHDRMAAIEAKEDKHEQDLNQLRDDVRSGADQLHSEIDSNQSKATQAHSELEASVDTRFAGSDKAVNDLKEKTKEKLVELSKFTSEEANKVSAEIWGELEVRTTSIDKSLVEISTRIDTADQSNSGVLQRVQALESQGGSSLAQLGADDYIRSRFEEYMENFLVSKRFWAVVEDTQLILKKQSNRERLRGQVQAAMEELLDTEEIQQTIYANLMERKALDNTNGNDEPLGDPPGVISEGRATPPGDISSDDNTGPTIPEESTIPDDADDHHGTRGVPPGDPPGVCLRGRAASLGGSTSDGPSCDGGTGPRPSGEDDDDALQPKRREGNEPCEAGGLTDEQLHGPADPEQPGGEDEETDEEGEDDDDDDAHNDGNDDGSDDDGPDDDGPPGPSPGSGGSNGHNGTGDDDNDDQDGHNGGAPRPFTSHGTTCGAPGLSNSCYASDPSLDSGTQHSSGADGGPQDDNDDGSEHPSEEEHKDNPNKALRKLNQMHGNRQQAVKNAIDRVEKEKRQQQQGQNLPAPAKNQQTAEGQLKNAHRNLAHTQNQLIKALDRAEQARNQPGPTQNPPQQAKDRRPEARRLLKAGPGLLQEAENQLTDLRSRLEHAQNEHMQQENQDVHQKIEDTKEKIQLLLRQNQPASSQSQPIHRQSQPTQLQNHLKQAQGHPMQPYSQPTQYPKQQTGKGQEQ
ncbi:hypothetical protein INS49_004982 [Diaporthe citri]|uniref:uncharacterized protein n=1 Tax=Diaporthe citri TaxID=83186 RepID=UPI001C81213E|nr:uncharacterized protein INS49_004982 [Diaporthe citri]KAG6354011.1 hypothetical protein INS49_004982 [Diaporthe citri]